MRLSRSAAHQGLLVMLLSQPLTHGAVSAPVPEVAVQSKLIDPSPTLDLLAVSPLVRAHSALYETSLWAGGSIPSYPDHVVASVSEGVELASRKRRKADVTPGGVGYAEVMIAIARASRATGIPVSYLTRTAWRESSFDPLAAAPTSSARGLFQFIEGTWLATVAKYGAEHGLFPRGRQIPRGDLLSLRYDAEASARMAAALALDNKRVLETRLNGSIEEGDLYVAHLLGAEGAIALIAGAASSPAQPAYLLLPRAASANPRVFYRDGHPLTASALLNELRRG